MLKCMMSSPLLVEEKTSFVGYLNYATKNYFIKVTLYYLICRLYSKRGFKLMILNRPQNKISKKTRIILLKHMH